MGEGSENDHVAVSEDSSDPLVPNLDGDGSAASSADADQTAPVEGVVVNPGPDFDDLSTALMTIDGDINAMELIIQRVQNTHDFDTRPLEVQLSALSTWLETVVDAGEVSMEETLEVRAQADALLSEMEWIEELAEGEGG